VQRDTVTLDLFNGPHIPRVRFEQALEALDFPTALLNAPEDDYDSVAELSLAVLPHGPHRADLELLSRAFRPDWSDALDRAWHRVVGLRLTHTDKPGTFNGKPAGYYLLRGGLIEEARRALFRHVHAFPRDTQAWALLAGFAPLLAAVRCAFHGGPVLTELEDIVEYVQHDELEPLKSWVLPYAYLFGGLTLGELGDALAAEGLTDADALPASDPGRRFAFWLRAAEERRMTEPENIPITIRRRLRDISGRAFRRYLNREPPR